MDNENGTVIVVGADYEYSSDRAVREALRLCAKGMADTLHVLHVVDPSEEGQRRHGPEIVGQDELLERAPELLRARIELLAREARLTVPARIHLHARIGKPAPTILQFATDYEADLLLVGTHGRKGMERLLLGSVAEQVVRAARCPVLVVRRTDYEGCTKTPRPDAPYAPGKAPQYGVPHDVHVQPSTRLDSWEPAGERPTGIRIV